MTRPRNKIRRLRLVAELVKRPTGWPDEPLDEPRKIATFCWPLIGAESQEVILVLALDRSLRLVSYYEAVRGTLHATVVSPREVFTRALLDEASTLVLAHNHPSGNVRPSPEDLELTRRMVNCGELLGVTVTDHLVISGTNEEEYWSMKCKGQMEGNGGRQWATAATGEPRSAGRPNE